MTKFPDEMAEDIRKFDTGTSLRKTFFDMKVLQFEVSQAVSGPIEH